MRLWLTKLSVVLITFMTFGVFIPPTYLDAKASENDVTVAENNGSLPIEIEADELDYEEPIYKDPRQQFISYAFDKAKDQSFCKMGKKISAQVGDQFTQLILPEIEEVIRQLTDQADEEDIPYYEMTERPSSGYGEKIFHIFHKQTKKDIARFHVHRIKHPTNGYEFNFHYHLSDDQFEQHYPLGNLYWDKNTPPKWMS